MRRSGAAKTSRRCARLPEIRAEDEAVGADADVFLVEDLCHGVVAADVEHDVVDADVLGVDELVAWSRRGRPCLQCTPLD